ncbi:MAG: homoserine kinase [Dehalococcoidia bacterium]|nr:homoserine kinase [Dehalococcoidia bacterium]
MSATRPPTTPPRSALVRVPATSGNVGSGFDSLGLAFDWTADFRLTAEDSPAPTPRGPIESMAATAALTLYRNAGIEPPPGVRVEYDGDIPVGRGLGVSAAARVAGVIAANELIAGGHSADTLLAVASQLEGHADNAAPAMLGGLQVIVDDEGDLKHIGVTPPDDLRLALLIPSFSMPTEQSRKSLPERLTRNQAVHNIGRAAMLVAALQQGRYELLETATEDVIHQPARSQIFQPMFPIFQAARDAGALAVFLSGGGPTIAAFAVDDPERVAGAMREAAAAHGVDGETRVCAVRATGAEVLAEA